MIAVSTITVTGFGIALTAGAYSLSLLARKHHRSPLTTPVLFSTVIIITVLLATGISFADYKPAKDIMTFLLGPATVALAIPLYKNRRTFFENLVPAGAGLLAGSVGTMIAAGFVARIFGFTPELVSSIAIKSTTVPIAVEVAKIVHGNPTLTAVLVVITGMLGASFGPWLMDHLAITNPISRGLGLARSRTGKVPPKQPLKTSCVARSLMSLWGSVRYARRWPRRGLFLYSLHKPARAGVARLEAQPDNFDRPRARYKIMRSRRSPLICDRPERLTDSLVEEMGFEPSVPLLYPGAGLFSALEPVHSHLGCRPVSAYGLLCSTIF
jgi:putative effector of murein hydrolase